MDIVLHFLTAQKNNTFSHEFYDFFDKVDAVIVSLEYSRLKMDD